MQERGASGAGLDYGRDLYVREQQARSELTGQRNHDLRHVDRGEEAFWTDPASAGRPALPARPLANRHMRLYSIGNFEINR